MEETEACKICKSEAIEIICHEIRGNVPCEVYRCNDCGLMFLPESFTLDEAKSVDYSGEYSYRPSIRKLLGSNHDPYQIRLDCLAPYLDPQKTRLLEIGAGEGHFIQQVHDKVKTVVVQELNTNQANACRERFGIDVYNDPVETMAVNKPFNVVCLFGVLEHVLRPADFLRSVWRLVAPDGILFLDVPNSQDPLISLYKVPAYKSFYFRPTHPFNFNQHNLGLLLKGIGLTDYEIGLVQNYSLTNHLHWAANGKPQKSLDIGYHFDIPAEIRDIPSGMRDKLKDFFEETDRRYKELLAENGYADMVTCIVKKGISR